MEDNDRRRVIDDFLSVAFDIIDDPRGDFPFDSLSGRRVIDWLYKLNQKRSTNKGKTGR